MILQKRQQFISDFYGEDCCCKEEKLSLDDINRNIMECNAMLQHFIDLSDKKEIAFWRKMLQMAKVQRREYLNT